MAIYQGYELSDKVMTCGIKKLSMGSYHSMSAIHRNMIKLGFTTRQMFPGLRNCDFDRDAVMKVVRESEDSQYTELSFKVAEIDFYRDAVWLVYDSDGRAWAVVPEGPHLGTVKTERSTSTPDGEPVLTKVTIRIPALPVRVRSRDLKE